MDEHKAIDHRNRGLAEAVYRQLLDDISEGRWRASETVSAYALSRRLGVSRTPAVEALKRLESQGLIEIVPRVGARLTESSAEATEELFSIVASLLGLAAARAAQRLDDRSLRRMDEMIDDVAEAAERGDAAGVSRLGGEFHRYLIQAGLPAHALVGEQLGQLLRAEARQGPTIRPSLVSELRAIVEALRARSPFRARAAAELHVAAAARVRSEAPPDGDGSASTRGGLEHSAVIYRSKAELIASALPFVLGGLQRDEPVLVVSGPENLEALGAALGGDRSRVDYRDSTKWYDDPASTLRRYRGYVDDRSADSRVRIIGEPVWKGQSGAAVDDWLRYESIINLALETVPASIMCPYDADELPPKIVCGALAAHPSLCDAGGISVSPQYRQFFGTTLDKEPPATEA